LALDKVNASFNTPLMMYENGYEHQMAVKMLLSMIP